MAALKSLVASMLALSIMPAFPSGAQAFTFGQFLRAIDGIHRSGRALCDGFNWTCDRLDQGQQNAGDLNDATLPDQTQPGAMPTAADGNVSMPGY